MAGVTLTFQGFLLACEAPHQFIGNSLRKSHLERAHLEINPI